MYVRLHQMGGDPIVGLAFLFSRPLGPTWLTLGPQLITLTQQHFWEACTHFPSVLHLLSFSIAGRSSLTSPVPPFLATVALAGALYSTLQLILVPSFFSFFFFLGPHPL